MPYTGKGLAPVAVRAERAEAPGDGEEHRDGMRTDLERKDLARCQVAGAHAPPGPLKVKKLLHKVMFRAILPLLAAWRAVGDALIFSSVNDVSSPSERVKTEAAQLLAAMGAVRRVARRAVRASAHGDPLPPARSELLRLAARRPGIGVAEAAAELRLAPNSVSTMVSKLAEDGLLNRGRVASDGRSVRLTVTEAGAAMVEQWQDIRTDLVGRALDRLAPADRQALATVIPALTRLAEQMEEL